MDTFSLPEFSDCAVPTRADGRKGTECKRWKLPECLSV
jgi:hypothetical protein